MKTVLSIDWDYWFKDRPEMDWGHQESEFYINFIWGLRASDIFRRGNSLEEFFLEGEEWKELPSLLENQGCTFDSKLQVEIAESHSSAFHAIEKINLSDGEKN